MVRTHTDTERAVSMVHVPKASRAQNFSVVHSFCHRKMLALLGAEVIAPRKASDTSGEKLQVRQKDCFRLKHVPYLLRKLLPELTHAHCGLVFLQSNAPYGGPGSVAEWSPTSLSTDESTAPGAEPPMTDTELVAWAERHFSGK